MPVQYTRNFAIGKSTHIVKVYDEYTQEYGLMNLVDECESGRIAECIKKLGIKGDMVERVKYLARNRQDGILIEDGSFKNY